MLCGAGFELPAEALFLNKKLMVIPMMGQYEQLCNGESLKKIGVVILDKLCLLLTNFVGAIKEAGVDGVITVYYPPEESKEFVSLLLKNDIDSIFLLSPTTEDERIKLIISQATGFIYYVSLKGVTGSANIDMEQVSERVNNVRQFTNLPVAVGFGVKDAKTAKEVAAIADAVVIGSRIVLEIEQSNKDDLIGNIKKLMREMKDAIE